MKCKILHETTGRLRVHLCCGRMTLSQEDVLEYYLRARDGVQEVKVYDRTQDAVVVYEAGNGRTLSPRWHNSPSPRRRQWSWCRNTPPAH